MESNLSPIDIILIWMAILVFITYWNYQAHKGDHMCGICWDEEESEEKEVFCKKCKSETRDNCICEPNCGEGEL